MKPFSLAAVAGVYLVAALVGLGLPAARGEGDVDPIGSAWVLPDHPSKEFPAGDIIPIYVVMHNSANQLYNMSHISGSLNLPNEFQYYVQNFSSISYGSVLPPQEEITFQYSFKPDKSLSPVELRVALTMFYKDIGGAMFRTTFFNETIDIVEKPRVVDYEAIIMVAVMMAVFGAIGYAALTWFGTLDSFKKAAGKKKGAKPTFQGDEDDWLQGTPHAQRRKTKGDVKKS